MSQQNEISTTTAATSSSFPTDEAVVDRSTTTTLAGSIGEEPTRKNDEKEQHKDAEATQPSRRTEVATQEVATRNQQVESSTPTIAVARNQSTADSNALLDTTTCTAATATDNPNNDNDNHPSVMQSMLHRVAVVFPKMEPLPWSTFFVLCAMVAVP